MVTQPTFQPDGMYYKVTVYSHPVPTTEEVIPRLKHGPKREKDWELRKPRRGKR